jgi:subfamily B ATP-binding cassette protein MsbA
MAEKRPPLLGRLWREHVTPYLPRLVALAPVILVVAATSGGYVWIIKYAGDLMQRGEVRVIYQVPAWLVGVSLLRAVAMYAQAELTNGVAHRVLRDLQNRMFSSLLQSDYARATAEPTGSLVSRFTNDIGVVSEGLVRTMSQVSRDFFTLLAAMVSMFIIDWTLALVIVVIFMLAASPLSRIAARARKDTQRAQVQMGDLNSLLTESFSGARLVRTYGLEDYERARAASSFEQKRKMNMRLLRNRARTDPLLEALGGLAAATVFGIIGFRIAHSQATIGDVLAFIAVIATASASARGLGTFNTVINEARAALERIFKLIDDAPKIVDAPGAKPLHVSRARIEFDRVSFQYGPLSPALHEVSFAVERGETIALVGPSGAGKTSVINLIPRLFDPDRGAVKIDGQNIRDVTLASLRGAVGLVSQDVTLFNDTVRANIAFGRQDAPFAAIEAAARAAAAHDFILALPEGYDTIVGEGGGKLSGGERQRLSLARAFLRDPPILLLDEATSALDAESERKVQEALARLSRGRTTLVIAHRLSTVREATRIVVLDAGRVIEIGGHEDLIAKGGLYARLHAMQFGPQAA